jgi:GNAT superfamily N-acetyltransferase
MLSFEDLGAGNWGKYGNLILGSENVFPEAMRTDKEDFIDVVREQDGVAKVALVDSGYAGNVFGYHVSPDDFGYYGLHDIPADAKVIYLFSIVINPGLQGKGYGRQLLLEFIKSAKEKGYDFIAGHFRQNGSLKLIKAFGAKEEGVCPNWENIGEDCVICCLDIHNFSLDDIGKPGENRGLMPEGKTSEQPGFVPASVPQATNEMHPEMPGHDMAHPEAAPSVHF